MKRWLSVSLALAVLVNVAVAQETAPRQMASVKDKVSYTIGFNIGSSLKSDDMDLDLREAREAFEREYLSRHLALSGNNMTELARRVGQERTHLYRKLKSLGLQTKKQ